MTREGFENYLLFVAVLSGALGAVNLFRPHKRWLGVGGILVGTAALLYRQDATVPAAIVAVLALAGMAQDVRTRQRSKA